MALHRRRSGAQMAALIGRPIDVVVIDTPQAGGRGLARYRAEHKRPLDDRRHAGRPAKS